ncbi:indole-3-glycerol phosphate synthase TrpC [Halanaerobium sp. Z-7514]|uniref:Indole-3-glycerol phosphate synthase n=1 Tax=Halanaerobium polyolivorans TaxID=2886943 RepID=A0AAW4WWT3_9FIRM|nr:indole-3-glycerol phosphate synthase TrpC [Halanaerobium polyolivorans]MCC3144248.1 indole-3-glycerol phosphate synthase TrpC [Halanaerobium polyolivorans]RQD72544.1 MAG: indole-3-glycerol phosphate synthase TrpC [Halanaerobium sp. MSAO_Bac5]
MILDKIIKEKEKEVKALKKSRHSLIEKLKAEELTLIAEIKKASPSKGLIRKDFKPVEQLMAYQAGGADAISVLTDQKFFQGSNQLLESLRKLTELPILRKEFIIDPIQVYQSFFIGADVILLIAAVLDLEQLKELLATAEKLKLEVIVEVHNEAELDMVLNTEAEIIGINNRNLNNFEVDLNTTAKLLKLLQEKTPRQNYYIIAESGIKSAADISYLKELGVDGVLIGETLMKAESPAAKIKELSLSKGESDHDS